MLNINSLYNISNENFLYLTEFFDLLFFKYSFFVSNINFNDFLLKKFMLNSLFSLKSLILKNEYFE